MQREKEEKGEKGEREKDQPQKISWQLAVGSWQFLVSRYLFITVKSGYELPTANYLHLFLLPSLCVSA
jgi:hypothetical protein